MKFYNIKMTRSELVEIEQNKILKNAHKLVNADTFDHVNWIKELLKIKPMTQRKLNIVIGAHSSGYITNVIKGRKNLTVNMAFNLSNVCNLTVKQTADMYRSLYIADATIIRMTESEL